MLNLILKFLPVKYLAIAGVIASLVAGFFVGYKVASSFYKDDLIKAYEEAEAMRIEDEEYIAELERRYLEATQKVRIETREIIKKVPEYITPDCRLTDDGVRDLNAFITGKNR